MSKTKTTQRRTMFSENFAGVFLRYDYKGNRQLVAHSTLDLRLVKSYLFWQRRQAKLRWLIMHLSLSWDCIVNREAAQFSFIQTSPHLHFVYIFFVPFKLRILVQNFKSSASFYNLKTTLYIKFYYFFRFNFSQDISQVTFFRQHIRRVSYYLYLYKWA